LQANSGLARNREAAGITRHNGESVTNLQVFLADTDPTEARSLLRIATLCAADFQLLIEPFGRNRHGGAKLLCKEGDLELFNHPPKRFELALRFC
jgi:hypothetical protein